MNCMGFDLFPFKELSSKIMAQHLTVRYQKLIKISLYYLFNFKRLNDKCDHLSDLRVPLFVFFRFWF